MSDFFETPIDELLNSTEKKKEKKKTETLDDVMEQIIRADMEAMLKYGSNGRSREFPDPVRPQWKN